MALKMAQDDDREAELDVRVDRRVLSERSFARKMTMLRDEFERKASEVQKTFETRTKKKREDLDRARKDEIKGIEERKHLMIDQLMGEHQRAFTDIKITAMI